MCFSDLGDLLFYGKGAGMFPTANAVVSDLIDLSRALLNAGEKGATFGVQIPKKIKILPLGDAVSKYYLRFQVKDRPGVLGHIAKTLGKHKISILSVHQKESHDKHSVPVVILTYEASESNLKKALKEIDSTSDAREKTTVIRVEKATEIVPK